MERGQRKCHAGDAGIKPTRIPVARLAAITTAATARCLKTSVVTFAPLLLATSHVSPVSRAIPHANEMKTAVALENASVKITKLIEIKSLVTKLLMVAANAECCSSFSDS